MAAASMMGLGRLRPLLLLQKKAGSVVLVGYVYDGRPRLPCCCLSIQFRL
jgi:hypothetical protein